MNLDVTIRFATFIRMLNGFDISTHTNQHIQDRCASWVEADILNEQMRTRH